MVICKRGGSETVVSSTTEQPNISSTVTVYVPAVNVFMVGPLPEVHVNVFAPIPPVALAVIEPVDSPLHKTSVTENVTSISFG